MEQDEQLSKFFGVCEKFNNNIPFDAKLRDRIENYFKYKWANDRNQALHLNEDLNIFMQIPQEI